MRRLAADAVGISLLILGAVTPAAAQAPAANATPGASTGAHPSTAPELPFTTCPVSLEAASAIAGRTMRPSPTYQTADGSLYVEHLARMPGGDPETTVYTCAYLSATGVPPDRSLFLQFSVGESAAWLWEVNGPTIEGSGMYQPLVDSDPSAVDVFRTTSFFAADGGAYPLPVWEADRYLHSDRLFAHIIIDVAGAQVHADQVELMASIIALRLDEALD